MALVPPPNIIAELIDFIVPLRKTTSQVRWVTSNFHVTLAFMAAVDSKYLANLLEGLTKLSKLSPIALRLEGAGAFPSPVHAKILWQGIKDLDDSLTKYAKTCRNLIKIAGISIDHKHFNPHLTLARAHSQDLSNMVNILSQFSSSNWINYELVLFESQLGRGPNNGPRHHVIEKYQLNGPSR